MKKLFGSIVALLFALMIVAVSPATVLGGQTKVIIDELGRVDFQGVNYSAGYVYQVN